MNTTVPYDLAFLHVHARIEDLRRSAGETRLRRQARHASRRAQR